MPVIDGPILSAPHPRFNGWLMGTRWIATLDIEDPMSCLLKERRISRDGRPAWDLCGVPSERTDFTTCSQGFTLGWYAMPRWGMGPKDNPDAGDARPNMEPTATLMEAMPRWDMEPTSNRSWKWGSGCPKGALHTSPGCNPGTKRPNVSRSEGTPHIPGWSARVGFMRRSFRTH